MKIKDYEVIIGWNAEEFERLIKKRLEEGYEFHGNLCTAQSYNSDQYEVDVSFCQAMVMYD